MGKFGRLPTPLASHQATVKADGGGNPAPKGSESMSVILINIFEVPAGDEDAFDCRLGEDP